MTVLTGNMGDTFVHTHQALDVARPSDRTTPIAYAIQTRDIAKAADVLSASFADYPIFQYVMPDSPGRSRRLAEVFRFLVRLGLANGEVLAPSERIEGVSIWFRSEATDSTALTALRAGLFGLYLRAGRGAHEYGHHVQDLLGTERHVRALQQATPVSEGRCLSALSCNRTASLAFGATPPTIRARSAEPKSPTPLMPPPRSVTIASNARPAVGFRPRPSCLHSTSLPSAVQFLTGPPWSPNCGELYAAANGSAHCLPKWTGQAITPGYHAASLPALSRRFVWFERSA